MAEIETLMQDSVQRLAATASVYDFVPITAFRLTSSTGCASCSASRRAADGYVSIALACSSAIARPVFTSSSRPMARSTAGALANWMSR